MLKDILPLMLAIILSFATGGSVQDEEPNDSVFQTETIYSFDGRLRVDIDATEMMIRLDITDEERGELLYSFSPVRRLDFWGICFEADNYNQVLRMLSIGICLETEKKNIIRVHNLLQKSKKEDWLLEFLACTYIGEEFDNNIKLLFKKEYEKFKDFIENSRNPSDLKQI